MSTPIVERTSELSLDHNNDQRWEETFHRFIVLVGEDLQDEIQRSVSCIHGNGEGLRCWINDIAYRGGVMPRSIPRELLLIYLTDPEALPLHDCGDCGLCVPVRPNRLYGIEGDPEERFFPVCPACGGPTGQYCFWSNRNKNRVLSVPKPR